MFVTTLLLLLVRKEARVESWLTAETCTSCDKSVLRQRWSTCSSGRTHTVHHWHVHAATHHSSSHHHIATHRHLHATTHVVHSHPATAAAVVHASTHATTHHVAATIKAPSKVASTHHRVAAKVLHATLTTVASHLTAHIAARVLIAHATPVVEIASVVEVAPVVESVEVAPAAIVEASRLLVIAIFVPGRYVFREGLERVMMRRIEDRGGLLGMCLIFEELFNLVLQCRGSLR